MHMTFSNAGNFQTPRALFIAAWKVWFKRFSNDHYAWREGKMPLRNFEKPLFELLNLNYRFSVEVLCRLMVPWSYRDTLQITDDLVKLNPAVLRLVNFSCDHSGDIVEGARLTDQALDYWDSLTYLEQDAYLAFAEARIQADIETPSNEPLILDDSGVEIIGEDIYPPYVPDKQAPDDEFIRAFVAWIEEDPITPMYQRQAAGETVSSWHDRFLAFFWPKPRTGYLEYSNAVSPLLYRAGELARFVDAGIDWNYEQREMAVKTANEIFMLAGVPQRQVTWQNVRAVMQAALREDQESSAKMNSGWTYIASLATAFLEPNKDRLPMVSWNSRTAASVISRLDFLLVEAGVDHLEGRFPGIGTVPGWGGTRPREFSLQWPSAYRKWNYAIAASRFIRKVSHILNTEKDSQGELRYRPMPVSGMSYVPWTTRGVQMVLFSDGY